MYKQGDLITCMRCHLRNYDNSAEYADSYNKFSQAGYELTEGYAIVLDYSDNDLVTIFHLTDLKIYYLLGYSVKKMLKSGDIVLCRNNMIYTKSDDRLYTSYTFHPTDFRFRRCMIIDVDDVSYAMFDIQSGLLCFVRHGNYVPVLLCTA